MCSAFGLPVLKLLLANTTEHEACIVAATDLHYVIGTQAAHLYSRCIAHLCVGMAMPQCAGREVA